MGKRKIILAAAGAATLAVGLVLGVMAFQKGPAGLGKRVFVQAALHRGNIDKTVSSSGTLEAVSSVSVLAQMSGRVERVLATYNDRVKKGQVLVQLNTDMLRLQAQEQEAAVRKAKANYELQLLDYQNKAKLAAKALVSDYDLKSSKSSLEVCAAELDSAQSALAVIKTEITQYADITSPIDGVVMACNVSAGQSVVEGSSSNASSLFTLAPDLARMQIKASVDELDIAAIRQGQKVRFSVEALPGTNFQGTVKEIRLVPVTSDNVVNYYVIILADNKENKLLPGMTAEVEFIEDSRQNVLLVPNAALRYQPSGLSDGEIKALIFEASLEDLPASVRDQARADFQAMQKGQAPQGARLGGLGGMMGGPGAGGPPPGGFPGGPGGPPGTAHKSTSNTKGKSDTELPQDLPGSPQVPTDKKNLWTVTADGQLAVLRVKTGVTNGTMTEILDAGSLENRSVIVKEKAD